MQKQGSFRLKAGALALGVSLILSACSGDSNQPGESDPSESRSSESLSATETSSPSESPTPTVSATPTTTAPSPTVAAPTASATPTPTPAQGLPANSLQVLVNKRNPLDPLDYVPADLTDIGHGHVLRATAAANYQRLVADAAAAGLSIVPTSSYRSYTSQVETHNYWRAQYGQEHAERVSARAGYSEHQTGLAVDVMPASGQCRLEQCFGQLPEGQWVASNAHKYGFIIRFPQGQESITGYTYEPWHLRYVGEQLSNQIYNSGQTLEEYYGSGPAPTY